MKEVSCVRNTYKLKIGNNIYHFRLSFMCWLKLEETYGTNAHYVLRDILMGIDRVTNMMKLLSCACLEGITLEELTDQIEFTHQNLKVIDEMVGNVMGIKPKDNEDDEEVKKNEIRPKRDEHIVDYEFFYTVARGYLGYSYNEFWYECNPYEFMKAWDTYTKINNWNNDDTEENKADKDYYTIEDII